MKFPIFLPPHLLKNGNKLQFDISLCYSFLPTKDNHLDYLPLHISFNIVKNLDIKIIAEKQIEYGIKSGFSWSEDHFGLDKLLCSNAQRKSYRLQPADIVDNDGMVALAVRCICKKGHENMIKIEHPFSIAIRITEIPRNKNVTGINLYSEIIKHNSGTIIPSNVMDMEVHGEDVELS